ncbi:MAG: class GN sortase [Xanthomonadales bacterium]|nr:class GN sortase [Xanthomonadales bacterium]
MINLPIRVVLGLGGLLFIIQAAWMPAKAQLGQHLLERNWQQIQAGNIPGSPWPGADIQPVAQLEVPSLDISQLVVNGQQGNNLAWAPGLVSAGLPGKSDTVISAHRDSHFRFLRNLHTGDQLQLTTSNENFTYKVVSMEIIDSNLSQLELSSDDQRLILTTCYPFDALQTGGPLRYVVTAVAI